MPYAMWLTKRVPVVDRDRYINECCVGGDAVVDELLPAVRARHTDVQSNQEDWGWFIWFRRGDVNLAIDVFTEDSDEGRFQIRLTSRTKRWLVFDTVADTPELEELRSLLASLLGAWGGGCARGQSSRRLGPDPRGGTSASQTELNVVRVASDHRASMSGPD